MFKKLIKWLTYESRKKRIENKIFQRILKKNPNAKFYDSTTGKSEVEGELIFKTVKLFDEKTGELIRTKKYRLYRIAKVPFISQHLHCVTRLLFDKSGNLVYANQSSKCWGFPGRYYSDYIKDDIDNFLWF